MYHLTNYCPFHPYCNAKFDTETEVLNHIKNEHKVARSKTYGDKYHGNGYKKTLEIGLE